MNKEFTPYEQALALKELGFDEPCFGIWIERGNKHDVIYVAKQEDAWMANQNDGILAPLYQQAFRWFREKYGLYHSIGLDNSLENDVNCDYQIINHSQSISEFETDFKSYEEAELECLKKLIEIVKQKLLVIN